MNLRLKKPLEKTVRAGHPWIFRDALFPFDAPPGTVVTILDRAGRFLARGLADRGPIGVRVYTTRDTPVNGSLFRERIREAVSKRDGIAAKGTTALRLIHGEGDRLPGLALDRYGSYAVMVLDGASLGPWRETIVDALSPELASRSIENILLRTRHRHEKVIEPLRGDLPDGEITVLENGMRLVVDLVNGQKTGLFLDHRDSRARVRRLAKGKRVLNLYGYTGGFSVAAGLGEAAEVTTVDIAPGAIALAEKSWAANGLNPEKHRGVVGDVPVFINALPPGSFDLIVADPPSFAPKKAAVLNALRVYRLLHASVFRALAPGGTYIAASCSSHVTRAMFESGIRDAARGCRRAVRIREVWGAGDDHPVAPGFPEGTYLKVFRVEG